MYRINEFLTPEERLGAIQFGAMRKLASMGVGPGRFMELMKSAEGKAPQPDSVVKALLGLSIGLGIPLGVLTYALKSGVKPDKNKNRKLKSELDMYNDVVHQYRSQTAGRPY